VSTPHPELETLAELADDIGAFGPGEELPASDRPGDAVRAHLATCAQCRADLAALRDMQAQLRALPPIAMPAAVSARLDAAVRDAAAAGRVAPVSVLPTRAARERRAFRLSGSAVAAGVAIIVVGGLVFAIVKGTTGSNSKRSSTAAGASASSAATLQLATGTSYDAPDFRRQAAALILGHAPEAAAGQTQLGAVANGAPDNTFAAAPQASSAAAAASAPAAAPSAAAPTASALSSTSSTGAAAQPPAPAPTAPTGPLADPSALQACVTLLAQRAVTPVVVDYATFNGKPATIIVLPDASNTKQYDVFVVDDDTNCTSGDGNFTYFATLPAQ
jgi:hypothetical protein